MISNKIYYISALDKTKIIELDILTSVEKILFSTDLKISYLKSVKDKMLMYSINMNGCDNNFIYNLSSGDMQKIIKENCLVNMPQIFNGSIYYISLYKGVNRVFVEDYN
jgi:ABC-type Mn2+/Zn2+ transport system ATPase subunit